MWIITTPHASVGIIHFYQVLSTMIGYGHMLKAQHDDTKWFLTFYMLW
jgi:hypothetical protein